MMGGHSRNRPEQANKTKYISTTKHTETAYLSKIKKPSKRVVMPTVDNTNQEKSSVEDTATETNSNINDNVAMSCSCSYSSNQSSNLYTDTNSNIDADCNHSDLNTGNYYTTVNHSPTNTVLLHSQILTSLADAFPDHTESAVLDSLQVCNWDADQAADRLYALSLNSTVVSEEQALEFPSEEVRMQVIQPRNMLTTAPLTAKQRMKLLQKQSKQNSLSVPNHSDQLQLSSINSIYTDKNHDQDIKLLGEIFPQIHSDTLNDALNAHQGDLTNAAATLSKWAQKADGVLDIRMTETLLEKMQQLFPFMPAQQLLCALKKCDGDVTVAANMLLHEPVSVLSPSDSKSTEKDNTCSYLNATKSNTTTVTNRVEMSKKEKQNPGTLGLFENGYTNAQSDKGGEFSWTYMGNQLSTISGKSQLATSTGSKFSFSGSSNEEDPHILRSKAQEYLELRNTSFRKAASAFIKGKPSGKAVAAYYAQRGHDLSAQMWSLNDQAAQAQLDINRTKSNNDCNVLDLHGLSLKEAKQAASEYANEWACNRNSGRKLKIVTGAGNHSVGGQARLYSGVWSHLQKCGWSIEAGGNGWFFVMQ
ncbi:hypothetical protein QVD99_007959 [Batrachochytrium dendrobatidis]|nr:hypothetical protein O5D80_004886 [Batrachochytrium dendrobatidis]KAK5665103.1 hypothetical protein QVD99_007959 [Batrachochytrium dendrobatidis]